MHRCEAERESERGFRFSFAVEHPLTTSPTLARAPSSNHLSPHAGVMEPPTTNSSPPSRLSIANHTHSISPQKRSTPAEQTLFSPLESDDDPAQQTSMSASVRHDSPSQIHALHSTTHHHLDSISDLSATYHRYRRATTNRPKKRQRTRTHHLNFRTNYPSLSTLHPHNTSSLLSVESPPQQSQSGKPSKPKISQQTIAINGRTDTPFPSRQKPNQPPTLWQHLADARRKIQSKPRADARFVPNTRPLDALQNLRTSIVLSLFPDGYVRHDWTASGPAPHRTTDQQKPPPPLQIGKQANLSPKHQQSLPPKTPNIDQLPRYPYDRNSADFLRCLDLGLIPHPEDLPEPQQRFYYDGCLIAEVRDMRVPPLPRAPLRNDMHYKILLRPQMSCLYQDIALLTAKVDRNVAQSVESKILRIISPSLRLNPSPQLTSYLSGIGVHTNIHPLNIIRTPKRNCINRPPGAPFILSPSSAVMLLISAAEKQQSTHRNNLLTCRSTLSETSSTATQATNGGISNVTSPGKAIRGSTDLPGKDPMPLISSRQNATDKRHVLKFAMHPRRHLPSKQLFNTANRLKSNGYGFPSSSTVQESTQRQQQRPFPTHERLRRMRLILPDRMLAVELQQAQSQAQAIATGGAAAERAKLARNQMISRMNKPGIPFSIVEMVRHPNLSVEIVFVRGITGEKQRDVSHTIVSCEEDGKSVMDQFKAIAKKEGYVCYHDLTASDFLAVQQQQQQQAKASLQQRQASGDAVQAQSRSSTRQILQEAGKVHTQLARMQRGSRQGIPLSTGSIQQLQQAHANQKQLQAQRHQHQLRMPQQQQQQRSQQQQRQQQLQQQSHHQLIRQHLQQQHQFQQMQNQQRARDQIQQLQRLEKAQQSVIHARQGGQAVSKNLSPAETNVQLSNAVGGSTALHTTGPGALVNGSTLPPGQMFPQARLQQLQQIRSQHLRADQHRNMLDAVARHSGSFGQSNNLTASGMTPQQLQNQALAAAIDNAAMNGRTTAAGRGVPNIPISGADGLNHPRLPVQMKHHRENVETPSRTTKR